MSDTMTALDRIRAVTSDVLKIHEGNGSTHYETCYLFHAGCLALLIHGLADDDKETEATIMHACDSSFGCALCGYTVCGNPAHSEYVPKCVAAIKDHRARVHGMQTPWL